MNKDLHEDGVDGEYGERDFDHNLHWKYLIQLFNFFSFKLFGMF